ncbi:hypothetical protein [Rhizobium sp. A37_96]
MEIIEAIVSIKAAIDTSVAAKTDSAWKSAVSAAGLVSQGDKGVTSLDESYIATFGPLQLRVNHTWRDTSKSFQLGPDRTKVTLDLIHNANVLDRYTNGYEV